jgi:diguanylate cyclase (GGDEF)-like protein
MQQLNVFTILVLTALNLTTVSLALPLIMGRGVSRAARLAQFSFLFQMLGWVGIISSGFVGGHWLDPVLSTAAMVCASVSNYLMFLALREWLGPRSHQRLLLVLVVLMPLGYAAGFEHYSWRVGFANLLLAGQLLIVGWAVVRPKTDSSLSWRSLIALCYTGVAVASLARGILGVFFPELYPTFDAPHAINVAAQVTANVALVLSAVAVLVAWREEAEAQLRLLAMSDGLTCLYNRNYWSNHAPVLFDQARRHGQPLALIALDLDNFKKINDALGHDVGDQVLRLVGRVLQANRRSSDLVARIGGEEFAILLPQTERVAALHVEHTLRQALQVEVKLQPTLQVTYSAGLAMLHPEDISLTSLMVRADRALYQAKTQGRSTLVEAARADLHHIQ